MRVVNAAARCAAMLILVAAGARAGPRSAPDVIIYEGAYPGWPWICRASDGTLYCVFREGTIHDYSENGRVMLTHSTDQGQSWSKAVAIIDEPEVDDRNTAVAEVAGQFLLLSYNTYTRQKASQATTSMSRDGGRTWSPPAPLDRANTRTKAAVVTLKSGRLVLPYYVAPGNGSLAALSDDQGQTFRTVEVPGAPGFVGDEWDLLELAPNRLVGVIRNSHPRQDGTFWQTQSTDGGQNWSVPAKINIRSQRAASPAQLAWHNKTPIVVYADRRMVSVSIARARDAAATSWDVDGQVEAFRYEPDESPISDAGYPVSVQIDQRTRLVIDYEIRPNGRRIAGYFVALPANW
jgi:hypothetical protein